MLGIVYKCSQFTFSCVLFLISFLHRVGRSARVNNKQHMTPEFLRGYSGDSFYLGGGGGVGRLFGKKQANNPTHADESVFFLSFCSFRHSFSSFARAC